MNMEVHVENTCVCANVLHIYIHIYIYTHIYIYCIYIYKIEKTAACHTMTSVFSGTMAMTRPLQDGSPMPFQLKVTKADSGRGMPLGTELVQEQSNRPSSISPDMK